MDPNYSMSCMKNFYGCYQLRVIGKYSRLFISEIIIFKMRGSSFLSWLLDYSFWNGGLTSLYSIIYSFFWRWTQSRLSVGRINKMLIWMTRTEVALFVYKKPQLQIFCMLKLVYLLLSYVIMEFMKQFTVGITVFLKWKA